MSSVFVFLLIFLCAPAWNFIMLSPRPPQTLLTSRPLPSLRVCSCLTTSHPPRNFHKHFFPWQQRKSSFFVFCRFLRRNLFFTSRCKRRWDGGSLDTQPRLESSLFMRRARASATQGRIYRKRRALTLPALV